MGNLVGPKLPEMGDRIRVTGFYKGQPERLIGKVGIVDRINYDDDGYPNFRLTISSGLIHETVYMYGPNSTDSGDKWEFL